MYPHLELHLHFILSTYFAVYFFQKKKFSSDSQLNSHLAGRLDSHPNGPLNDHLENQLDSQSNDQLDSQLLVNYTVRSLSSNVFLTSLRPRLSRSEFIFCFDVDMSTRI